MQHFNPYHLPWPPWSTPDSRCTVHPWWQQQTTNQRNTSESSTMGQQHPCISPICQQKMDELQIGYQAWIALSPSHSLMFYKRLSTNTKDHWYWDPTLTKSECQFPKSGDESTPRIWRSQHSSPTQWKPLWENHLPTTSYLQGWQCRTQTVMFIRKPTAGDWYLALTSLKQVTMTLGFLQLILFNWPVERNL